MDDVVAMGEAHNVCNIGDFTFKHAGLDWEKRVRVVERYLRPTEADALNSDASQAGQELDWTVKDHTRELSGADGRGAYPCTRERRHPLGALGLPS